MSIEIEKLHAGYAIRAYPHRSLVVSAQDLRDIYDWCLLHMAEIEAKVEADILKQQQQQLIKIAESAAGE